MPRWILDIKEPTFDVWVTRLFLKTGDGFVSGYQHSGHSCGVDYYQADLPHDVLEILVNRAEMIAHMNQAVWMPRPVSVTNPFALSKDVGFTELEMSPICLFGDC